MDIRRLRQGDEEKLEKFLIPYTESSMFLRGNLRLSGLEYRDEAYYGEYFAAFDDAGAMRGVLAHYWNGNIMAQAPDLDVLQALTAAFHSAVSRPVAGILAPEEQAQKIISALGLHQAEWAMSELEDLYALNLKDLHMPALAKAFNSTMAHASTIGRALLHQWFKDYNLETLGAEEGEALEAQVKGRVDRTMDNGQAWVLNVDNRAVAMAGINARLPDIVQIGPVWTPPEERGKGYARAIVALVLEKAREEGIEKSVLFTKNPFAAKAYEAIGFRPCGTYRIALFKKPITLR